MVAIILGLFVIGVGITAIFFPSIVVGLVTVLFSIAFIMMGFWALSMGVSGRRVTMVPKGTSSSKDQELQNQTH